MGLFFFLRIPITSLEPMDPSRDDTRRHLSVNFVKKKKRRRSSGSGWSCSKVHKDYVGVCLSFGGWCLLFREFFCCVCVVWSRERTVIIGGGFEQRDRTCLQSCSEKIKRREKKWELRDRRIGCYLCLCGQ